jgi:tRNA threonylcarbamoyl adenosine modification protein YeaZ
VHFFPHFERRLDSRIWELFMYKAALDTSSAFASFAVADIVNNHTVITDHAAMTRKKSAGLILRITELLRLKEIRLDEISHWTIGMGPGSFTGIRVGAALVKGICCATGARYRGLPSSLAMAIQANPSDKDVIAVLHDGRRNEMIVSSYLCDLGQLRAQDTPFTEKSEKLNSDNVSTWVILSCDQKSIAPAGLGSSLVVLEHLDAGTLINPTGWQWPETFASMEASAEPVYVGTAVWEQTPNIGVVSS